MKGMNQTELIEKLEGKLKEILIIIYTEKDVEKMKERIEEVIKR